MTKFTIERFLENTTIKGLRLVAGEQGIFNAINNANIIDNPDSYEWFTAGDFLLTTGYIYQHDEALQKQLIKELSEMNCAGLGVKIHRYWDKVPETIISEANKVHLPIIEIPYMYSLAQVTNFINQTISKRENSLLNKYKSIHEAFNRCSLEDGDFFRIVEIASEMIKNPVILVDSRFNLLSYYDFHHNPKPLNNYLNLSVGQRIFSQVLTKSIPVSSDKFTLSIKRKFPSSTQDITLRIIPIAYAKDLYGYLFAWETMKKLESIDYVALETAATTAALRQIKLLQIEESRSRLRDSFFDDLLQDKIISIANVESLAKMHGLNINTSYVIAVLDINHDVSSMDHALFDIIAYQANQHRMNVQVLKRHNNFVLFIPVATNEAEKQDGLRIYLQELTHQIESQYPSLVFKIGVGSYCKQLHKLSLSFKLAQEVLHLSQQLQSQKKVVYFDDMRGYHLLQKHINQTDLLSFFNQTLGELYDYDNQNGGDLLKTLEVYFQHNANLSEAAKAMYVHRNTFIYRLDKIKKILKTDLKNSEENFLYMLALHIYKIISI